MKKLAIFNGYIQDPKDLINDTKNILGQMGIETTDVGNFNYFGGYWDKLVDEKAFLINQAKNLEIASMGNADILSIDEDAYLNLSIAKDTLKQNPSLLDGVILDISKILDTEILYFGNLKEISGLKTKSFEQYTTCECHSSINPKINIDDIYEKLSLKKNNIQSRSFFHIKKDNAIRECARSFFEMVDSGVDFITSLSYERYCFIKANQKKFARELNRECVEMPMLFLPQILMWGIKD